MITIQYIGSNYAVVQGKAIFPGESRPVPDKVAAVLRLSRPTEFLFDGEAVEATDAEPGSSDSNFNLDTEGDLVVTGHVILGDQGSAKEDGKTIKGEPVDLKPGEAIVTKSKDDPDKYLRLEVPDIKNLTVAAVRDLASQIVPEGIRRLIAEEKAGRARKTAIEALEARLSELENDE